MENQGRFDQKYVVGANHFPRQLALSPTPENAVYPLIHHKKQVVNNHFHPEADPDFLNTACREQICLIAFPVLNESDMVYGIYMFQNRSAHPFTTQDSELGALLLTLNTETQRAMTAVDDLKKSVSEYKRLFNNLPDVFYRTDLDGNILLTSPSIKSLLGYSPDEVSGKNLFKDFFKNPAQSESFQTCLRDMNCPEQFFCTMLDSENNGVYISASAQYYRDIKGNIEGIEGILRNITELRQAEEEQARLATAIEQASEFIFIMDREGKIKYVNPSFEKITGYSKKEIIGQNPIMLSRNRADNGIYKQIWDTISHGKVWKGKLINRKKDKTLYHVEATISPIRNGSNKIINHVAVQRDITKESMLERQLTHAQKMEAIGTLAGGIAHDFNNVLASIMGYTELARLEPTHHDENARHLENVLKAANRAKDLVGQILSFSRKEEPAMIPVDLKSIIADTIKLLRPSLPSTIEIHKNIKTNDRIILGDPTQIHQMLMNICTNAGHAMRENGGILYLTMDEATTDSEFKLRFPDLLPADYLMLCLEDTGHGIPKELLARIFDPYFTTKEKGEGTGLGLAIAHGIVERYGGQITVQSEPGNGTRFNIYLPHAEKQESSALSPEKEAIKGGNEKILLVDDEKDIIYIGKRILERLGYTVTGFTSSVQALEAFKETPDNFDVLITDMTMPVMTGDCLALEIKKIRPKLPVLLCTGFSEKMSREKAGDMGIHQFLQKPLTTSELATSLRLALDGRAMEIDPPQPSMVEA